MKEKSLLCGGNVGEVRGEAIKKLGDDRGGK